MAELIAARLADALDLIVNCDAFAEPFASQAKRDPDAEAVRQQRIEDVLAAGRRALSEYDAVIEEGSTQNVEHTLREALRKRGYREDGNLITLAERCLHMAREDRDLIGGQKVLIERYKAKATTSGQ